MMSLPFSTLRRAGMAMHRRIAVASRRNAVEMADRIASSTQRVKKRREPVMRAAGSIHDPRFAEDVVNSGRADCVAVGRGMLFDPRWVYAVVRLPGIEPAQLPQQALAHPSLRKGSRYCQ